MIGERLKAERERLGLTQPQFAEAAGAAKRTLIEWEKGTTSPSAVQLSALSKIGVDVTYVLTGETRQERAAALAAKPSVGATKAMRELHGTNDAGPPAPAPTRDDLARGTRLDPDWPLVMEWVYDALNARKLRMPDGKKLRELVDAVLVLLRLEQGELDREKTRRKIDAIL
ncbi:MAG: hypothetical protein AzoDbin1_04096 [Azoarcus sp.]|nr:hypothetical protein [Azoarcus sp.]